MYEAPQESSKSSCNFLLRLRSNVLHNTLPSNILKLNDFFDAVPGFSRLVAEVSPRRPGFANASVSVGGIRDGQHGTGTGCAPSYS
jgi:hypothetical protein